ncbi:hypothetical protein GCM10027093_53670 [Paraburkholderia jirisanensis]
MVTLLAATKPGNRLGDALLPSLLPQAATTVMQHATAMRRNDRRAGIVVSLAVCFTGQRVRKTMRNGAAAVSVQVRDMRHARRIKNKTGCGARPKPVHHIDP